MAEYGMLGDCSHISKILITAPKGSGKTHFLSFCQSIRKGTIGIFFTCQKQLYKFKHDYKFTENVTLHVLDEKSLPNTFDIILFDEILSMKTKLLSSFLLTIKKETVIMSVATFNVFKDNHIDNAALLVQNDFYVINL